MKKIITKIRKGIPIYLLTFAALLFTANSFAANYTSSTDGPWNSPTTWGGAGIPGAGDDVTVSHHVTHIGGPLALASLSVNGASAFLDAPALGLVLTNSGFEVVNGGYMNVGSLIVPGSWDVHWIDELSTLVVETNFTYGQVPEISPSAIWLDGLLVVKGTFTITGNCAGVVWKNVLIAGWGSDGKIYAGAYAGCGWIWGDQADLISGNLWAWSGEVDDDWETPGNWRFAGGTATGIPTASDDIVINPTFPDGLVQTPVVNWPNYKNTTLNHLTGDCNNLTISPGCQMTVSGEMDIFGDLLLAANQADGTGSFLASGYATIATGGTITAEVYVPLRGNGFAMLAPPIASSLNQFIADNGITQSTKLGNYTYDVGLFDEPLSRWAWYTGAGGDHTMTPGRGLMIKVPAGKVFKFTGTQFPSFGIGSGEPVGTSAFGFNGLGNPFAASMDMDAYLAANTGWGAGVSPTAWYYDGTDYAAYDVYGTDENAQYGQGFLVQADKTLPAGQVSLYTQAMQTHSPALGIKSNKLDHYRFKLHASLDGLVKTTKVNFRFDRSVGLDPIADALLFNKSKFELYSIVDGYPEERFEIQALPEFNLGSTVMPVGLDCIDGGEVIFSASDFNMPDDVMAIFLEDKETGRYTDISSEPYTAVVEAGTSGDGRFYIHFKSLSTGIEIDEAQPLKAFYNGYKEIQIEGQVGSKSVASVFDMSGKLLGNYQLKGENHNVIPVGSLENGVYILRVVDGEKVYKTRVPVL